MDREKFANGLMWISMAILFIFTSVVSLYKGFQTNNNLFLVVGGICVLGVFFFGVAPDVMQTEGDQWIDCVEDKSCVELRL